MPTNHTATITWDDTNYQHWYQLIHNVATTNTATSQSDFTWWTRTPYSTGDTAHATTGYPKDAYMYEYEAVYAQEREPETEDFDITELEKYIDSLKKEVVETES